MLKKIIKEYIEFSFSPDALGENGRAFDVQVKSEILEQDEDTALFEIEKALNQFPWHMLDDNSDGLKGEIDVNGQNVVIHYTRGSDRFLVIPGSQENADSGMVPATDDMVAGNPQE
jgi:hypothetical protein